MGEGRQQKKQNWSDANHCRNWVDRYEAGGGGGGQREHQYSIIATFEYVWNFPKSL